ncbi:MULTISPECIES: 3-isopropylmalate dehydratase small subunit [Streptomyces]|uniref:3-isopropylmalate dehydratase small subunit n=1 Tax=Streptomyces cacaoi TaxID=1898 RepID=A0A4Y3QYI3_STRCI|nr:MULTISPECIES: 3-isopropylmalate dehydratase small subunit [Streptomyces]NNG88382.1 3-isopropylmalate dehydratase small subunit [Streptomyces cacaoi]QHF94616.1 3-isopropylmalate dehydratase small subunit [Streptomyces sp. NHF165]GEB49707.1 3-isopropylmalate dehydratase small subunit [Streptomyces cacaoi]
MEKFTVHHGTAVPLRRSDVDTDQIIPVRFLNHSERTGHADALFADWRTDPGFVLNQPRYRGASVLIAGRDFGTGSSREYAVWALLNYGFRAVVAPRFGDIFHGNALMNGLLPVTLPEATVERLWDVVTAEPARRITVDLTRSRLDCGDVGASFRIEEGARRRLLSGLDLIGDTLRHEEAIAAYESTRRSAMPTTTSV